MQQKKEKKEEARDLRSQGFSVNRIAKLISVSKSSVSLWVRDIPQPERFTLEHRSKRRGERLRQVKEAKEAQREERVREREERIRQHVWRVSQGDVRGSLRERIISGDGRWMIPAPEGYKGKTYIGGRYVYEHRYMMEQKIGRLLNFNEVVHHKNGNKLDNSFDNLELKTRSIHSSEHAPLVPMESVFCNWCEKEFKIRERDYKYKKKIGQKHFYCCRSHQVSHKHTLNKN